MSKNLKGKEPGAGISRRKDGRYSARFVTSGGKRIEKYFPMLQDTKANREMLLEMKKQADRGRYAHVTDEEKTKEMQKFEEYSIKIQMALKMA